MNIYRQLADLPAATTPIVATIGNFDGVHLGHRKLLKQVTDRAQALGLPSMAVTFSPHPEQVLFPERKLTYLSLPDERLELMQASGIDDVWMCEFTPELARLEPDEFMRMVAERQPMAELWVGADFALGRGRKGTIAVLAEIGSAFGWGLHIVPPYMREGQIVSSTAIRTLLAAGAVRGASDLLGRAYRVRGTLEGEDLVVDPTRALPRIGPYEAQLHLDSATEDRKVTVLATPGRIHVGLMPPTAAPGAPATLDFIRRAD
jgi:riboflavin kinase/FMN adenylyltransferase